MASSWPFGDDHRSLDVQLADDGGPTETASKRDNRRIELTETQSARLMSPRMERAAQTNSSAPRLVVAAADSSE
jgi:hypothetical protein